VSPRTVTSCAASSSARAGCASAMQHEQTSVQRPPPLARLPSIFARIARHAHGAARSARARAWTQRRGALEPCTCRLRLKQHDNGTPGTRCLPRGVQVGPTTTFFRRRVRAGLRTREHAGWAGCLLFTASQPRKLAASATREGRSRSPLRGSPGFTPGSLSAPSSGSERQHGTDAIGNGALRQPEFGPDAGASPGTTAGTYRTSLSWVPAARSHLVEHERASSRPLRKHRTSQRSAPVPHWLREARAADSLAHRTARAASGLSDERTNDHWGSRDDALDAAQPCQRS
jgi:hypothetical protein